MKHSKDKLRKLNDFTKKSLDEKLAYIKEAWQKHYPKLFEERGFFEKIMGEYRYKKADGWAHTTDIADNFKGVDFYKGFTEIGDDIFAETAVSMKTTTMKNVDDWLNTTAVKSNIQNLRDNIGAGLDKGITWKGKTIRFEKAEIHIYTPQNNIEIKNKWIKTLKNEYPEIEFKIDILEDFIK